MVTFWLVCSLQVLVVLNSTIQVDYVGFNTGNGKN